MKFHSLIIKKIRIIFFSHFILSVLFACQNENISKEKQLFIKDKLERLPLENIVKPSIVSTDSCATQIAEIILKEFFGSEIETEKPLRVDLFEDSIWIIEGSYPLDRNWRGGVAHIEIRKCDGMVLGINHGN